MASGSASSDVAVRTIAADWQTNVTDLRGQSGPFAFTCPANPPASQRSHSVWGSGPYTDDSSVCRAAVHAGAITYEQGGRVVIEMRGGQSSYSGSTRNGVQTLDYGAWGGGFVVIQ